MNDYLLLMHALTPEQAATDTADAWGRYLVALRATGRFDGGSAIAGGRCCRKQGPVPDLSEHLTGYLRVRAENLAEAERLLDGNPIYEAGGTVEIRLLPKS